MCEFAVWSAEAIRFPASNACFHGLGRGLMGSNPRLDEDLPVLYIQQQRTLEVIGAAEAFVEDTYAA